MKFMYIFFLFCLLRGGEEARSEIYEGKNFPVSRVFISDIDNTNIIAEVGATTDKMGADYIILHKVESSSNNILATNNDKSCALIKKNKKLYFQYKGRLGNKTFRLKKRPYTSSINQNRLNIFRSYFLGFKKISNERNKINDSFEKFKESPYNFLSQNDT